MAATPILRAGFPGYVFPRDGPVAPFCLMMGWAVHTSFGRPELFVLFVLTNVHRTQFLKVRRCARLGLYIP